MTRQEVAKRIAIDLRSDLVSQGMLGQDAADIVSSHGATVLVTDTPRGGDNGGTPDKPVVTETGKDGGPTLVQFVDGPNGK